MLTDKFLLSSYIGYGKNMKIEIIASPNIFGTVQVFDACGKPIEIMELYKFYDYCFNNNFLIDTPIKNDQDDETDYIRYIRSVIRLKRTEIQEMKKEGEK